MAAFLKERERVKEDEEKDKQRKQVKGFYKASTAMLVFLTCYIVFRWKLNAKRDLKKRESRLKVKKESAEKGEDCNPLLCLV